MITEEKLCKVRTELERYNLAEKALRKRLTTEVVCGCIESAALKRTSLDLSRALVQLRMNSARTKKPREVKMI